MITGFGRTGDWSGSRHWGVKPDMMCLAKAITNGYFPFGAVMITNEVAETFEKDETGVANIGHGYTYSAHPVGAAAALACLAETKRLNVAENAAARGRQMFEGVRQLMQKHALVGDVRGGHGLMTAVELVSDRDSKTPADKAVASLVAKTAYENGVMVRVSGHNILLSPPLIIESGDVQQVLSGLDAGLSAAA